MATYQHGSFVVSPFHLSLCLPLWVSLLTVYLSLSTAETIVNVLDFKKDVGLWHGILTVRATHLLVPGIHSTLSC